jgi:hypothetical protein
VAILGASYHNALSALSDVAAKKVAQKIRLDAFYKNRQDFRRGSLPLEDGEAQTSCNLDARIILQSEDWLRAHCLYN